jgi:hypothetical protein
MIKTSGETERPVVEAKLIQPEQELFAYVIIANMRVRLQHVREMHSLPPQTHTRPLKAQQRPTIEQEGRV